MDNFLQSFTKGIKTLGIAFVLAGIGVFAIALVVPSLIGGIVAILLMVGGGYALPIPECH